MTAQIPTARMSAVSCPSGASPFDISELREIRLDFPALQQPLRPGVFPVYLDAAATALKCRAMIETTTQYYEGNGAAVHRGVHTLSAWATDAYEEARRVVAEFLNAAHCDELIFTKGTTESINLLATSFCEGVCRPGDEILLSELEHHANIVPWQIQAARRGLVLRWIPLTADGAWDLEALPSLLTERTRLVAVSGASNVLGQFLPIETVIQKAHEKGIPVMIDAAQRVVHECVDVQALGCDFCVFSGHKLTGPTGIGVLYAARRWQEVLAPYQGGGHMIETVSLSKSTFQSGPAKFEPGSPNIAGVLGLAATLRYLARLGWDRIHAHMHLLSVRLAERLAQVPGLRGLGGLQVHDLPLYACVHERYHAYDLATLLDHYGIAVRDGHHCAMPLHHALGVSSSLRASALFHNSEEEIHFFSDQLINMINKLGG